MRSKSLPELFRQQFPMMLLYQIWVFLGIGASLYTYRHQVSPALGLFCGECLL